jgi:AraC-like DNA-binding protein
MLPVMPIDDAMPVRLDVTGTDLDDAATFISDLYGADLRAEAAAVPFVFRYAALGDETLSLHTARFAGHVEGDLPPSDTVIVQWLQSGSSWLDTDGGVLSMEPGVPVPLLPDRTFAFEMHDYEQRLVHLSREVVERVAAEQGADVSAGLRFDHTTPPSEQSVRTWHNTVALVSHTLRDGSPARLLHAEMARLAAASLLEMYPQQRPRVVQPVPAARSAHVRAAVEYVHENARTPITTSTLARHVDISLRALQEAFQRDLQTTPNAYIRQVRLERTRQELLVSDPGSTSVRDVAAAWGFAHLGRFTQQYTAVFGETPKTTLDRRPGTDG